MKSAKRRAYETELKKYENTKDFKIFQTNIQEKNVKKVARYLADVFFKSPFSKEDKRDGRNSRIEFLETAKNLYNINFDINGKKFSRCLTIRKQNSKVKINTVEKYVDDVCIRVENYCQKESDKSENQLRHISPEKILLSSLSMDINFVLFHNSTSEEEIKFVREEKFIAVMKGEELIKKFKSPLQSILFVGTLNEKKVSKEHEELFKRLEYVLGKNNIYFSKKLKENLDKFREKIN
ncbi:Hypothetical protein SRAE_0000050500 [Strongyloides ratti]|uniref:Uncharacterized protein n=1 Tax=Strongyloides ratti TaxID=34506 RepID=A0A090L1L9_STRRB|nr:Hypothetical protein SRAE_0000050500 [Strongyloides ratti]CEF61379.1 Hypothetical protein SRAE_0000050500 [Strongyloides ratti]